MGLDIRWQVHIIVGVYHSGSGVQFLSNNVVSERPWRL